MNLFPMEKLERRDETKFHSYIHFSWPLAAKKKNQPKTPKL